MPVVVVGADTPLGAEVTRALEGRDGELRAFVSDPATAERLKGVGFRVALGDVSDGSHVAGAAYEAFSAVLITAAASDDRERAFASTAAAVLSAWETAMAEAGVRRPIWVGEAPPGGIAAGAFLVETGSLSAAGIAARVVEIDDLPA